MFSLHFLTMLLLGAMAITLVILPLSLFLSTLNKKPKDNSESARKYHQTKLIVFGLITIAAAGFSSMLFLAFDTGEQLDTTSAEEDGTFIQTMQAPEEKSQEELKEETNKWKSSSQKSWEDKLNNQEDPDLILKRALQHEDAERKEEN